jgi:hypothetical protein
MSDFALKAYNGTILAVTDKDKLVLGTAMLGEDYGRVKSATLTRTGEEEELKGQIGQLIAFLVKNPGFELKMECAFDSDVVPPEIMDAITFPLAGIVGYVKPGTEVSWEEGGVRMLSFTAAGWDSLQSEDVKRWRWDAAGDELVDLDLEEAP